MIGISSSALSSFIKTSRLHSTIAQNGSFFLLCPKLASSTRPEGRPGQAVIFATSKEVEALSHGPILLRPAVCDGSDWWGASKTQIALRFEAAYPWLFFPLRCWT